MCKMQSISDVTVMFKLYVLRSYNIYHLGVSTAAENGPIWTFGVFFDIRN